MIIDERKCRAYPFDERYLVSECGHVYSTIKKRWIKLSPNKHGYLNLGVKNPTTPRNGASIHRVVAFTWLGNPPEGKPEVNHKDGNKSNNSADNLEWCSRSENIKHGFNTQLFDEKRKIISENNRKLWAEGKKRKAVEMGGLKRKEFTRGKHEGAKKVVFVPTGHIFDCILDACEHSGFLVLKWARY